LYQIFEQGFFDIFQLEVEFPQLDVFYAQLNTQLPPQLALSDDCQKEIGNGAIGIEPKFIAITVKSERNIFLIFNLCLIFLQTNS
jgi:hypothetical protein